MKAIIIDLAGSKEFIYYDSIERTENYEIFRLKGKFVAKLNINETYIQIINKKMY